MIGLNSSDEKGKRQRDEKETQDEEKKEKSTENTILETQNEPSKKAKVEVKPITFDSDEKREKISLSLPLSKPKMFVFNDEI